MKLVECMEVDTQDQADEREDWRSGLLGLLCAPRCASAIAGRPRSGKTALAMLLANEFLKQGENRRVLYWTFGDSRTQLARRAAKTFPEMAGLDVNVFKNPEFCFESLEFWGREGCLVILDYLNVMSFQVPTDVVVDSRQDETGYLLGELDGWARESGATVLVLAQARKADGIYGRDSLPRLRKSMPVAALLDMPSDGSTERLLRIDSAGRLEFILSLSLEAGAFGQRATVYSGDAE